MDNIKELKKKINNLSEDMGEKQKELEILILEFFKIKIKKFISLNLSEKENTYWNTIKSFYFSQCGFSNIENNNNAWKCIYIHETDNYIINNYCINEESEDEDLLPCFKRTKICFGYNNGKYFIQNDSFRELNDIINVYTRKKLPYLYNLEYENICEIDTDDIMEIYSNNIDIPEWLLIKFLLQINHHKYYPSKIKRYFSIV